METTTTVAGNGYKDRSTGLLIFGILLLLIGGVCALFIPLLFAGQMASTKVTGDATSWRMILPSVVTYLILAATFIALGIGSIKARRWARALALIIGWNWLVVGVFTMTISSVVIYRSFSTQLDTQQMPAGVMFVTMTIMAIIFAVIFVIVPGALVLFYGRKDVKATCETRDPVVRWTDSIPLPVLALALWIGFGAITMLSMPMSYNGVLPFFGKLISGLPGTLISLALAVLWGYCAWAIYKLNPLGWWIVLILVLVFGVSSMITFQNLDLAELYTAMGYSTAQIEEMEKFSFGDSNVFSQLMAVAMLPFLGFLLWVKRYFPKSSSQVAA